MNISKVNFHTVAFSFLAVAACSPTLIAKTLVTIAVALIAIILLNGGNLNRYLVLKFSLCFALMPGFIQAINYSLFESFRFFALILLILGYPYYGIRLSYPALRLVIKLIILWLVSTQILIAIEYSPLMLLRDTLYPIEINAWDYGEIDSFFLELRSFRAGGLYYNPNVLGIILVLFLYIYYYLVQNNNLVSNKKTIKLNLIKKKFLYFDYVVILYSIFGIWLTGSRTALIGVFILPIIYFKFIQNFFGYSKSLNIINKILVFTILIFFIIVLKEQFIEAVTTDGSAYIKIVILLRHLEDATIMKILFGGVFNLQFDAEYGYWIGSSGLLGMGSVLLFFLILFQKLPQMRPIVLLYVVMSIGSTILYGLLTASIMIFLVILGATISRDNIKNHYAQS
jgi:hypothetical protein